MSTVENLRSAQMELRELSQRLGDMTLELKNHPDKPDQTPGVHVSAAKLNKWAKIKSAHDLERAGLKHRLTTVQAECHELAGTLDQKPLTKASLGHVIDTLTQIEACFEVEGPDGAWDKLSAFTDWLEREEERASELEVAA